MGPSYMDAVGSARAALFGVSEGVQWSVAFAARYPERTIALALYGGAAGAMRGEQARAFCEKIAAGWGTGVLVAAFAPSVQGDERLRRWLARIERLSATPVRYGFASLSRSFLTISVYCICANWS